MGEGVRVRELPNDKGNRLLWIVRRCSGSGGDVAASADGAALRAGMDIAQIATVAFTSPDRVRDVINKFNDDGFESLYPRYVGGRPQRLRRAKVA